MNANTVKKSNAAVKPVFESKPVTHNGPSFADTVSKKAEPQALNADAITPEFVAALSDEALKAWKLLVTAESKARRELREASLPKVGQTVKYVGDNKRHEGKSGKVLKASKNDVIVELAGGKGYERFIVKHIAIVTA